MNSSRVTLPAVKGRRAGDHPIDAFIRATLARERLTPSAEADRRTLIRRLSLDLTGLPPDARDVEAYVASRDPQAYEKLGEFQAVERTGNAWSTPLVYRGKMYVKGRTDFICYDISAR